MNKILAHPTNYTQGRVEDIEWLVVHYVGNAGTSAKNNALYFANHPKVFVSAHYTVDDIEVINCVDDTDTAYHCGTELSTPYAGTAHPYFGICTNRNSIGIEMACIINSAGDWEMTEATQINTIGLIIGLLDKYPNIKGIIRHYDVTGKNCPEPFVRNEEYWLDFKARTEDNMASMIQQIADAAGLSVPETITALGTLAKFANTTNEDWENKGSQALVDMGLISQPRKGREPVEFGEFGTVLKRFKDKFIP